MSAVSVRDTLGARSSNYGSYNSHERITQNIKNAMRDSPNWTYLTDDKKEALEMVATKIARILNGDPEYHDSWHDIIGYVTLVIDALKGANVCDVDRIKEHQHDMANNSVSTGRKTMIANKDIPSSMEEMAKSWKK